MVMVMEIVVVMVGAAAELSETYNSGKSSQHCGNILWALAAMKSYSPNLLDVIECLIHDVENVHSHFRKQEYVSNPSPSPSPSLSPSPSTTPFPSPSSSPSSSLSPSPSTTPYPSPSSSPYHPHLHPQSNMVWSLRHNMVKRSTAVKLLQALPSYLQDRKDKFNAQALSNMMVGVSNSPVFTLSDGTNEGDKDGRQFLLQLSHEVTTFTISIPISISISISTPSPSPSPSPPPSLSPSHLHPPMTQCEDRFHEFHEQGLANTCWALAKHKLHQPTFSMRLAEHLLYHNVHFKDVRSMTDTHTHIHNCKDDD